MKKLIPFVFIIFLGFLGCSKSSDSVAPAAQAFPEIVAPGTWKISS